MATSTFDKRIVLNEREAEFIAFELGKEQSEYTKLSDDFINENERKVNAWLSNSKK